MREYRLLKVQFAKWILPWVAVPATKFPCRGYPKISRWMDRLLILAESEITDGN